MKKHDWIAIAAIVAYIYWLDKKNKNEVPKVKYVDSLPQQQRRGMCIPPFGIYIRKEYMDEPKILEHELCHWKQYQDKGFWGFYLEYAFQAMEKGYKNMNMECECGLQKLDHIRKH